MTEQRTPQPCQDVRERLAAAIDQPLSSQDQQRIDLHVSECDECKAVASWIERVDTLAAEAPSPVTPGPAYFETLAKEVGQSIGTSSSPKRPWWTSWFRSPSQAPQGWILAALVVMVGAYSARELSRGPSPLDRVAPVSQVASIPERVAGDERSRVDARDQPAAQEPNAEAPTHEAFADEAKIAQAKNNEQETGEDADPGLAARRKRDHAASPQPATPVPLGRSIAPGEPSVAPAEPPAALGKQSGGVVGQRAEEGEEEVLDSKAEHDAFRATELASGAASADDLNELRDADREALTEETAVETRMYSLSEGEAKLQAQPGRVPSTEAELRRLLVELAPDRDETEVRDAVIELVEMFEANPSPGQAGALDQSSARQVQVYRWSTIGGSKEKSLETAATLQDSLATAVSLALDRLDDDELRARTERALGLDESAEAPDQR